MDRARQSSEIDLTTIQMDGIDGVLEGRADIPQILSNPVRIRVYSVH